ncbi:MAG: Gfo/Idh/MocA family oxidoreductase [Gemmatimonadetes bacterium]|nr:Gfo/Idh/MocA family oxidoreductase [Gemmatimonadota bacterium]MBT4610603.1 Gfo/Idh/MocA family oxidoreductase [Gemmatimonadota bacterium]MBT5057454.1 Gfo/Idh/MocA family oxidoreductase [Gemmatimonadota bacterium]MBT5143599.1 Gfo/Idh/MocA family oxidoreductase [Gemmatimonadota bacterium]MBT5588915.1 Gfo/Idh/MocA family oxidoreductase [Gemmatimonadota bacterium]
MTETAVTGVLVIGAGWVSTQHILAYKSNPQSQIRAICNRNPEKARQRADEAGLKDVAVYSSAEEALQHDGIDVVSICTPQHIHCANVVAAAQAGKHLLIEKPLGNSLHELRQMREAVDTAGVKTVAGFVLRWNPLFQNIKSLIAAGDLGEIYHVETDYQSYNSGWWGGWDEGRRIELSHSAMAVAGCHAVDTLRWFAGQGVVEAADPVEVFAYAGGKRKGKARQYNPVDNDWSEQPPMEYDGLEIALVRFANGVVGKVSVNFEAIQPYSFPLGIYGDRGTVKDNRLFLPTSPEQTAWREIPGIRPDSSDVTHHPFQGEIDHFLECVRKDVESHCNLADAIKTHEIFFAAHKCYQTGQPVSLPLL